ncbi:MULTISPECIES: CBS domain-containing protein [Moorena]|uniref:Putative signal-transduction protein n=2 Tax=Moorena TaxID=1155738 RepID=F4Y1S5_9CYAN|nr:MULTISPECIES: CBS domain-containing protein [Moorena]NEQ14217.1 CBS domain-containing protein [Moorena sp. SIO3E2]EGJ29217.1 putative signal-transduction protein [Moorena producens 3L]NEP35646.1 CBS domain-containing protein [Moorena sp. SIO3B2]NEP67446.1 CBS domain-containing protein [Moorena sp. SIO3A5]NEQ08556.1 CBS domain-containing protein [Moorena sp. SIO4E2]
MAKTVAEVMTRDPIVVQPETPIKEVIKIIAEQSISGLPVVNEAGKLVGVISETDLLWQETGVEPPVYIMFLDSVIYLENPARYDQELHKALGQTAGEVMTGHPMSIKPDQPLRKAAKLMQEKSIHHLPVTDEAEQVIGILSSGDIVRAMAAELKN